MMKPEWLKQNYLDSLWMDIKTATDSSACGQVGNFIYAPNEHLFVFVAQVKSERACVMPV